ncbi:MAG TPA: BrnT family toxin [Thermoanaerobaculia bacterium]|nr:BrnT family toxin [Thermoanaerobaculia bacterium]
MQSQWFEWDDEKAKQNLEKHGVSFQQGCEVFDDPMAITSPDEEHSDDEDREVTIGCTFFDKVLVASHILRGERIRIISVRRATNAERRLLMNQPTNRIHDKPLQDEASDEPGIDFSKGIRGKYYSGDRLTVMVKLDSDVARHYSSGKQVNDALRMLIAEGRAPAPRTE